MNKGFNGAHLSSENGYKKLLLVNMHEKRGLVSYFLGCTVQRAKKVVSDSPGLVDFAIGLIYLASECCF